MLGSKVGWQCMLGIRVVFQLLDRCADGMAFGALKRCSECGRGHFSYK